MTVNEVISIASNNIGDGSFANLTKAEYEAFVNDVAQDLFLDAKASHVARAYLLPDGEYFFDIPDRDIISFAFVQFRWPSVLPGVTGASEPEPYDPDKGPERVKEKDLQKNIADFTGRYEDIGDIEDTYHVTPEIQNISGKWRVTSARKFTAGMTLHAHCITTQPRMSWTQDPTMQSGDPLSHDPVEANLISNNLDTQVVWEPFRNLFQYGVTWRAALRHLRYVKDPSVSVVLQTAQGLYYNRYLPQATHYIHRMKDASSTMNMRPFRYLPE